MKYSLYVHIPFCARRCNYCNFYSSTAQSVPQEYVNALKKSFNELAPQNTRPETLYFGGGTPSLLSARQLAKLIEAFNPQKNAEITLEINPEDATEQLLREVKAAGVNRLSVGVQTANEQSLARLGRRHTAEQSALALKRAANAGFENISADLMLALPFYSKEEIDQSIDLLVNNSVKHVSAYILKIEKSTAFGKKKPQGLPNSDETADYYLHTVQKLEAAGFNQYEISNFAQKGFEGKHNLCYWHCGNYLGLGAAAHSCMNGRRFYFENDLQVFIDGAASPIDDGGCTAQDYLMLALRLAEGLNEREYFNKFGGVLSTEQKQLLEKLCKNGLCVKTAEGYALTAQGFLVQNSILAQLLP